MSSTAPAPLRSRARAALVWLGGPLAVGALLRLWNLHRQVLLDDELHGLRRALRQPVGDILFRLQSPDTSLPLTAATHVLLDQGVKVSEWMLRAPSLLAGWLLAAIGGLFLARRESPLAGACFAGLAASSPLLVIYSRNARPYAVALTLAFSAAVLFLDAWDRRSASRFACSALLGGLAIWTLPTTMAIVGAPWLAGVVETLSERRRGQAWRREFLAVSGALLLALVALLAAMKASIFAVLIDRAGRLDFSEPREILEGALLAIGARAPVLAVAMAVAAVVALALAARRGNLWGWVLLLAGAAHLVGLAVLRDRGIQYAIGAGRALLLATPILLCGLASALARLAPAWREHRGAAVAAGLMTALVPFAAGPLPERLSVLPELLSSADRMQFTLPAETMAVALPEIYRREPLASAREIVDVPHLTEFHYLRPLYGEALAHRRRLRLGLLAQEFPPSRVQFEASIRLSPRRILNSGADALLCRLRPGAAALEFERRLGIVPLISVVARAGQLDVAAQEVRANLLEAFGPPDVTDDERWVWDLRRLRRGVR